RDAHTGADEGMALTANAPPDGDVARNFDERADAAVVADFTAVQVDEFENRHAATEFHIVGDVDKSSAGNFDHARPIVQQHAARLPVCDSIGACVRRVD